MRRYVRGGILVACVVVPAGALSAQSAVDPVDAALAALTSALPTPPIAFVGITPCRLADTRGGPSFPPGPFGPPSMAAQSPRVFPVAGNCGIPPSAQAVSANIAVTNTSGVGFLSVWPGGAPQPSPLAASLNYSAGQTIANAVLAPLGGGGITVYSKVGVDLIIDVNGYFDTGAAGPTGPTGPSGPSGPTGGPGPAGFTSFAQVTTEWTATRGSFTNMFVDCTAPNSRVLAGGARIRDNPGSLGSSNLSFVQHSSPSVSGNAWEVRVRNDGNNFDNPVTVYAICVP
jgi:hypothetical protein